MNTDGIFFHHSYIYGKAQFSYQLRMILVVEYCTIWLLPVSVLKEPIYLDKCVVSVDTEFGDSIEVLDIVNKESYLLKVTTTDLITTAEGFQLSSWLVFGFWHPLHRLHNYNCIFATLSEKKW